MATEYAAQKGEWKETLSFGVRNPVVPGDPLD